MKLFQNCTLLLLFAVLSRSALAQADQQDEGWTGTWGAAPSRYQQPNGIGDMPVTIREIVHLSAGGQAIRVRLSNVFGTEPLVIERTSIGLRAQRDTLRTKPVLLTFQGAERVTIPVGGIVVSDGLPLEVQALSDVAVSLFVPAQAIQVETVHLVAFTTNYSAAGDQVSAPALSHPSMLGSWPFLADVEVLQNTKDHAQKLPAGAIVCLGDSITAGVHSTPNTNASWPDQLSARLQAVERTATQGVLNEGIPGNRVLQNGKGPSARARFERDVLSQTNVKYLLISEGINDVGVGYGKEAQPNASKPTAQELETAYTQMAKLAHAQGIKVIGATITPYGTAQYYSRQGDLIREEVNSWIRTVALSTNIYDGVVDFDYAVRAANVRSPEVLNPLYNSGDGLHPNDVGYRAMSDMIYEKMIEAHARQSSD